MCFFLAKKFFFSYIYIFKVNQHSKHHKGPVTQHSTSKSRSKSSENLVDVVGRGNSWSILAWPCFCTGMAVGGCSTAKTLPKLSLSTANHVQQRVSLKIGSHVRAQHVISSATDVIRPRLAVVTFASYCVCPRFNHCRNTDYHVCFTCVARLYHVCHTWLAAAKCFEQFKTFCRGQPRSDFSPRPDTSIHRL